MQLYYKLEGKKVVACSMYEASEALEMDRHVAFDKIGDVGISTVFLVINHSRNDKVPLLFETMVFGGEYDEYCDRYSTWQDAEVGHKKIKEMVLSKV